MTRYSIYKNKILQDVRSSDINFNIDGRTYYVYRVTDLTTLEYYYGSRYMNITENSIHDDFWNYCTSSNRKDSITKNKKAYKVKIIAVFDNPGDMYICESFYHQLFNVKSHNRFWNNANQHPWGFSIGHWDHLIGKKQTKEHIKTRIKNGLETKKNSGGLKRASLKASETKLKNSRRFNVLVKNVILYENITKKELMRLSQGLLNTNSENTLGSNNISKNRLIKSGKEELIGSYIQEIIHGTIKELEITRTDNKEYFEIIKDSKIINTKISRGALRRISQVFERTTEDKPLGYSKASRAKLIGTENEKYIGSYIQKNVIRK